ncbi:tyrosine--tRNA ligase [Candidatus Synechococcus calcipolaris G9]|uniref:Tyrosine--tRNA ligase n=1 Tax=Candidatus Synechococcus calcipolaris G9 TaxID=1497997 RepID=A0ABT6EVR5_9SYNE|nr:tyrosine--tRNA ligase [Candidatus Synechococcus calcipolaris]MDG2989865.1 tyrosine--tRNA ligase [Candidatus Synechococcus calcipolaris G9]
MDHSKDHLQELQRGVVEVFPDGHPTDQPLDCLWHRLKTCDRPLRIKLGIDPTGSDVHLGHSIVLRKLRQFQDAGHCAVLIMGDFTAQIGDPTGKSDVRRQLTPEDVQANVKTYLEQVRPILDFDTPDRLEICYNSEWLSQLNLSKILNLLSTMTVGQMLAKEGFSERYGKGNPIFLHEFLYPLMQGYDSVAIEADVELGGTDQKFNIAVGRDLQRHFQRSPQFGLLMPILPGTDGIQKMSKSLGNYVALTESAVSMYSKLEKVPDGVINQYLELLTDLPLEDLPPNPRDRQKLLALEVVGQYHGRELAQQTQRELAAIVTQGAMAQAESLPEFSLGDLTFPLKISYLISQTKLCSSSSEARRQIKGGGVRLNGEKVMDPDLAIAEGTDIIGQVLQVGKKKFIRFVP